jgi:hypothetical protein
LTCHKFAWIAQAKTLLGMNNRKGRCKSHEDIRISTVHVITDPFVWSATTTTTTTTTTVQARMNLSNSDLLPVSSLGWICVTWSTDNVCWTYHHHFQCDVSWTTIMPYRIAIFLFLWNRKRLSQITIYIYEK